MNKKKNEWRKLIRKQKELFSIEELKIRSLQILKKIEQHPKFIHSQRILLYHSLPDEVYTHDFIEQWSKEKEIFLPVVKGDELFLYPYTGNENLTIGSYGIQEPSQEQVIQPDTIELAIIPGMAFDVHGNRLGRGKGYYDRLLPLLTQAYKIGICFDFQYQASILPHNSFDQPMDDILNDSLNDSPL